MRSLTEAEARVIRGLLAGLPGPERVRVRMAGVARTTYQTIRLRALVKGWLQERYIPNPALLGSNRIRFIIAQPYADRWSESVRTVRSLKDIVVLWVSPETLFAVVYDRGPPDDKSNFDSSQQFRRSWTIAANPNEGQIPVYFDYEGTWSRWTLDSEPLAYPHSFS